jgi:hypothetical protein
VRLPTYRALVLPATVGIAIFFSQTRASEAQSDVCTFPTASSVTMEETAWQLFVAANCPTSKDHVAWENWIEQLQFYPATGAVGRAPISEKQVDRRLHGSPLARAEAMRSQDHHGLLTPITECNTMRAAPLNVIPNATICEEVRLNPDAAEFATSNSYQLRPAQTAAAKKGTDIEFPKRAIEVKVDWLPATDFETPFTCSNPPAGVHVEIINGVCYAMVGMHISSKLRNNWIWATFEPQSMLTNPLRCITFGDCNDPWGSDPAISSGGSGGFTQVSPALKSLMTLARLAPEFLNYRLDGVQVDFTAKDGAPTYLGNSIIEGENVGLKKNEASCITCHSVSSINYDGTDGFSAFINLPKPPVGRHYKNPANWISRDFVWSMGFACPDPTSTGEQACH